MVEAEEAVNRERMIAFIDLLGYGTVLKGMKLLGPESIWGQENTNDRAWSYISLFYKNIADTFDPNAFSDLRLIGFSDGLFIVLTDESDTGLGRDEIITLCWKIQELLDLCTANYIPLRGGISIGSVKAEQTSRESNLNYFAGLAINQAVEMEQIQEWIGISFVPPKSMPAENRDHYCELLEWISTRNRSPVLRWDVPTKSGLEATYTIGFRNIADAIHKIKETRDFEKEKAKGHENKYRGTLQLLRSLQARTNMGGDEQDCTDLIP